MSDDDHIGVVREHRWTNVKLQRERLKADGCRVILDMKDTTRADLFRIVRSGTTVKLFRAYYLADPRNRKKKGGMKADALATLRRLCCKPPNGIGAVVKDVETGLSTADPAQKAAIVALIKDQATRDGKGLKSAANGANSKRGRVPRAFTADEMRDAKAVWRNLKDYPTWDDAQKALPKGFTVHRAFRLWKGRK
jgi:hypothetical protein